LNFLTPKSPMPVARYRQLLVRLGKKNFKDFINPLVEIMMSSLLLK